MGPGGVMVFDDDRSHAYRNAARAAVDEFFGGLNVAPIVLQTGQAVVTKV